MGGNELTDSGVATIAAALHTCAVRRFSLAGNNMQDDGARALAAALVSGFSPEQLDLSGACGPSRLDRMLGGWGSHARVCVRV